MKAVVACLVFAMAIHCIAACNIDDIQADYQKCAANAPLSDTTKQCDCLKTFVGTVGSCGSAYKSACESALDSMRQALSGTGCNPSCNDTSGAAPIGVSWLMALVSVIATLWFA